MRLRQSEMLADIRGGKEGLRILREDLETGRGEDAGISIDEIEVMECEGVDSDCVRFPIYRFGTYVVVFEGLREG